MRYEMKKFLIFLILMNIEFVIAIENDSFVGADPDVTEYTIDPSSVELVVELDPKGYGFRTRDHKMVINSEFDALFRGRAALRYDYRFFEYLSFGVIAGGEWSKLSLFDGIQRSLKKPYAEKTSLFGGLAGKWRLTEWFLRSAVFLEPSILLGPMWQAIPAEKKMYWRLRPGIFLGGESVFDSGLVLNLRLGLEFPQDLNGKNPVTDLLELGLLFGIGLAI